MVSVINHCLIDPSPPTVSSRHQSLHVLEVNAALQRLCSDDAPLVHATACGLTLKFIRNEHLNKKLSVNLAKTVTGLPFTAYCS